MSVIDDGGPWREWTCTDCDPTIIPDEPIEWERPYSLLLPQGTESPDHCPRCGAYLSFTEGAGDLRITNTPAQRWAEKARGR